MLTILTSLLSRDIALLISHEFLGRNTLSIPIQEVHSAYKAGYFQILEICETLQHPFVQPCFLGYLDSGEPNESLVDMLINKVYDVEMIFKTPRYRQMISIHSMPYFTNLKYTMFNTWQTEWWNPFDSLDCASDSNLLLTSDCIMRSNTPRMHLFPWNFWYACQHGATRCYACDRSPSEHTVFTRHPRSGLKRMMDSFIFAFGPLKGSIIFVCPSILGAMVPALLAWWQVGSVPSYTQLGFDGIMAQLSAMIAYGLGHWHKIKCRNPRNCWKIHWTITLF